MGNLFHKNKCDSVCVCVCVGGGGIVYNYCHDGCGENGLISDSIIMINLDCTI